MARKVPPWTHSRSGATSAKSYGRVPSRLAARLCLARALGMLELRRLSPSAIMDHQVRRDSKAPLSFFFFFFFETYSDNMPNYRKL